jgi:hypothetical protein
MLFQSEMPIRQQLSEKNTQIMVPHFDNDLTLGVKNLERKDLESRIKEIAKNIGFAIMLEEKIVSKTDE